jgi:hypothetical protein
VLKIKKGGIRNLFFQIDLNADTEMQVMDDKKFIIVDTDVDISRYPLPTTFPHLNTGIISITFPNRSSSFVSFATQDKFSRDMWIGAISDCIHSCMTSSQERAGK